MYLVIGSEGLIGQHLLDYWRSQNISAYGLSRKELDLEKPVVAFPVPPVRVAIIAAGESNIQACEASPIETAKVNVTHTAELIDFLCDKGVFVIFLSSTAVFSGKQPFASTSPQPTTFYGRQKLEIEQYLQQYHPEQSAVLRLGKVFHPQWFLLRSWLSTLKKGQAIEAFSDASLSPVTIRRALSVIELLAKEQKPGLYEFSSSHQLTYYDFAVQLALSHGFSKSLVRQESAKGFLKDTHYATVSQESLLPFSVFLPPLSEVLTQLNQVVPLAEAPHVVF